jgi:ubiquinone/menaquinone biosynthesis C-methylase UbiE
MSAPSPARIREANVLYHDATAGEYDAKWGIDFGPVGQGQVRAKLAKALGGWPLPKTSSNHQPDASQSGRHQSHQPDASQSGSRPLLRADINCSAPASNGHRPAPAFDRALEIGAGTGYFTLNLLQLGLMREATATDISPGMLAELGRTARDLDLEVDAVRCDAERLPFADESFDLVFGHAVLHHIPDLRAALEQVHRVLRPGGSIAFCGEPSRYGNALAGLPKRAGLALAPLWRRGLGVGPRREKPAGDPHALEHEVDVHSFSPGELRGQLRDAGFATVRIRGEELVANLYGWFLRTLESTADPRAVPFRWQSFAFRSYRLLQRLDGAALEPNLPPELFYNLVLSARKET